MSAPRVSRKDVHDALVELCTAFNKPLSWATDKLDLAEERWHRVQPLRLKKIVKRIVDTCVDPPRNVIATVLAHHRQMPYSTTETAEHEECPRCTHGWIVRRVCFASKEHGRCTYAPGAEAMRCTCSQGHTLDRQVPDLNAVVPRQIEIDCGVVFHVERGDVYIAGVTPKREAVFVYAWEREERKDRTLLTVLDYMPAVGDVIAVLAESPAEPTPEPAPTGESEPVEEEVPF